MENYNNKSNHELKKLLTEITTKHENVKDVINQKLNELDSIEVEFLEINKVLAERLGIRR